jgi:hypothetical protein
MASLYDVEVEPEVRGWLEGLNDRDFGRTDFLVGYWPSMRRILVNPTRVISAGRCGNYVFICCGSRHGLRTGWPLADA